MKKCLLLLSMLATAFKSYSVSQLTFEKVAPNKLAVYLIPDFSGTGLQMYDMTMNMGVPTAAPAAANSNVEFVLSPAMSTVWPAATLQSNGSTAADKPGNTIYYRQWSTTFPTMAQVFNLTSGQRFLIGTWVFHYPTNPPPSAVPTIYDNADGGVVSGFTQQSFSVVGRGDVLPHTSSPFAQNNTATAPNVGTNAPAATTTTTPFASTPQDYSMSLNGTVALPVTLISFDAVKSGASSAELKWIMAEEKNMDYYEVERSGDARSFDMLATRVKPNNNPAQHTYTIDDNQMLPGRNYYRLKMVDLNGDYRYSAVKSLDCAGEQTYTLSPNPATDYVMVRGAKTGNMITLLSVTGQTIATYPAAGEQTRLELAGLAAGQYQVRVTDGEQLVFTGKLTKRQ